MGGKGHLKTGVKEDHYDGDTVNGDNNLRLGKASAKNDYDDGDTVNGDNN